MSAREPIPAAFWWRSVGDTFEKIVRESLSRARKAEQEQTGHECGHRFEVTVRSSTHLSGPDDHSDSNYFTSMESVTVRAHNLRDALLVAATLPLSEWFTDAAPESELETVQLCWCIPGSPDLPVTSPHQKNDRCSR